MKSTVRTLLLACMAALCLALAPEAQASAPEIINYALYTDITATVDGHPLRSFNIDGSTAVVAEDLRGFGFWVLWDAEKRTLHISRALKDGEPETPEIWPAWESAPLTHRIGTRAKPVYATDIVTSAAGETLESFNIDGETLVWMEDLSPFGSVVWDAESRVISLTLGDPVELALAPVIESVEQWRSIGGAGSSWETYDCPTGTLLVTRMTGTPHGGSTGMLFVRKTGDRFSINGLLPYAGPMSYLAPGEITIDGQGYRLSFLTPVRELTDWPDGTVRDLGVCRCVVDLLNGVLLSMERQESAGAQ